MAPDTKLLKAGIGEAVSSVLRALLANLMNFTYYDFVVRAVFKITEDERLHQLHFHENCCMC